MAAPVQTLSYFARRLIQLEKKFAQREGQGLREAAALFRGFSADLDGLLDALEAGSDFEPACLALRERLPALEAELQAEMGPPESDKLMHALREALEPGRLGDQMAALDGRALLAEELDKAAILVRALADGLHVDPVPQAGT